MAQARPRCGITRPIIEPLNIAEKHPTTRVKPAAVGGKSGHDTTDRWKRAFAEPPSNQIGPVIRVYTGDGAAIAFDALIKTVLLEYGFCPHFCIEGGYDSERGRMKPARIRAWVAG